MALATMNPKQSRHLALGLLIAAIVVIVAAVATPIWLLHRQYDVALADNASKYDRYRRIAGTRPELAKQLEAMRAKETRKFFLRAGAPALSAAEAQEAIRTLVEQSGGRRRAMAEAIDRLDGQRAR